MTKQSGATATSARQTIGGNTHLAVNHATAYGFATLNDATMQLGSYARALYPDPATNKTNTYIGMQETPGH